MYFLLHCCSVRDPLHIHVDRRERTTQLHEMRRITLPVLMKVQAFRSGLLHYLDLTLMKL